VIDREGTKRTISQTWEAVRGLAWRPDGREVWYTAAHAGVQYAIRGSASNPSDERLIYAAPGGVLLQDVSRDGKAIITRYDRSMQIEASLKDADARGISWLDFEFARDITPNSQRILVAYSGQGSSPNYDVYVHTVGESDGTRVGEGQPQQFSPDGASVLAVVHGPPAKLMILPVGAGEPRTITTAGVAVTQARWLPDGRHLLIVGTEQGKGVRAYLTDVSGGGPRAFTPEGITFISDQVALSPDGGRVAFRAPDRTVVIYSIDGGPSSAAKGLSPEQMPVGWTGDGRSLLLLERKPDRRLVAVDPVTSRRAVYKILKPSEPALNGPSQIHLTPDGRSYVANYGRSQDTLFLVEGLK
jgi:dipeptidyl aminopeptidase/acylaminoacyl peptidase